MHLTRHSEMIKDVPMNTQILIVGAGSIGSYTALALAKLGFNNLVVADDGIIEEENIAPQWYRPRDIGTPKVNALKKLIKDFTGTDIVAIPTRLERDTWNKSGLELFDADGNVNSIVILAVDSMAARKDLASLPHLYIIDSRMAIQFLTVVSAASSMQGNQYYRDTLFDDKDAVQENCTNKAISYTSLIAGGLVAKCVLDVLKKEWDADHRQTINFDIHHFDMVRL